MDANSVQALVASLKMATESVLAILQFKPSAKMREKVTELQSALMAAQNCALAAYTAQFELQEQVRRLAAQLKALEDWGVHEARYRLVSPWRGPAQVYALRASHAQGEKAHHLCPSCFLDKKRAILSPRQRDRREFIQMVCPKCGMTAATGWRGLGPAKYAEEYLDSSDD